MLNEERLYAIFGLSACGKEQLFKVSDTIIQSHPLSTVSEFEETGSRVQPQRLLRDSRVGVQGMDGTNDDDHPVGLQNEVYSIEGTLIHSGRMSPNLTRRPNATLLRRRIGNSVQARVSWSADRLFGSDHHSKLYIPSENQQGF